MQGNIGNIYARIQSSLVKLIPENWVNINLYASVIRGRKGEMFFYYEPKKLIKAKPINCYEIPAKFGLNDELYNKGLSDLYNLIKMLHAYSVPKWTNINILMNEDFFVVEHNYNDLMHSRYTDEQRRTVWGYKYLGIPLESMSVEDQYLIRNYKEESRMKPYVLTMKINGIDLREEYDDSNQITNQILKT